MSAMHIKKRECLELHGIHHHPQQGREKVELLKKINYRAIFRKREHIFWNRQKSTCVNLFRVRNEDTPRKSS